MIPTFTGCNAFMSNFHPSVISWAGGNWATAEHLYQARKTDSEWGQRILAAPNPGDAKKLGQCVPLRRDWELVEGNYWHDQIWGSCLCVNHQTIDGMNALGILLMRTRLQLITEQGAEL